MKYELIDTGGSRSFPMPHDVLARASGEGEAMLIIGEHAADALVKLPAAERYACIAIELQDECLGVHTGESRAEEGSNVLGFARFRLGRADPTPLIELVRQPRTSEAAIAAACAIFENAGLQVALCGDFAGRIVDRLVRPYYNAALTRLDEGLATADDLDKTLRLGLGYPEGPIALLERTGLEHHFNVTQKLFEAYRDPAYAPARRARVAKQRSQSQQ